MLEAHAKQRTLLHARKHAPTHKMPTPQYLLFRGESPVISLSTGWQYESECVAARVSACVCMRSCVCVNLRGSSFFRHSGVLPAARHRLQRRPGEVEPARLSSLQGVSSAS